jgi:CheY-like chemotaxis protein
MTTVTTTTLSPAGSGAGLDTLLEPRNRGTQLDPAHERLCALGYLIVGDQRFARSMIKSALNGFGFRNLTECESAEHALKVVQGGGVDAIIVEHDMPGTGGAEFAWRLRRLADERARRLPVVMVGNDAVAAHVGAAVDSGVNEYLPKPYSRRDLYARIRRAALAPKPFVIAPGYVGPDRRILDKGPPRGDERRTGLAMSVQLYTLVGSEPRWIRTAKLGTGEPASEVKPEAAPGTKAPASFSAAPSSVLAESDFSGGGAGERLAARLTAREPRQKP